MKKLIITGTSSGLGAYIAEQALVQGYHVIGLSRTETKHSDIDWRRCDVADPVSIKNAIWDLRRDSSVYGLINAAGVASMNLTIATPPETAHKLIAINLLGTIYCSSLVGKWLIKQRVGRIINFSSLAVQMAIKGEAIYAASKAGVETFSRSFAREMGDFNVTVNTIAPGPIDTRLLAKVPKKNIEDIVSQQLITRNGTPEDVWKVAKYLLSEDSAMITGDVFHIGGA
jgi:3-oxoacyl-[acyl-carrier protein] reductase